MADLTTSANTTMRQLHERMPVILEPDDWAVWLENAAPVIARLPEQTQPD